MRTKRLIYISSLFTPSANYLDNWKCIQELKGSDGGPSPALVPSMTGGMHSRQDYPTHRGRNTSSSANQQQQQQNGASATREQSNAPQGGRSRYPFMTL